MDTDKNQLLERKNSGINRSLTKEEMFKHSRALSLVF